MPLPENRVCDPFLAQNFIIPAQALKKRAKAPKQIANSNHQQKITMEPDQKPDEKAKVWKNDPTAAGRNANDNFNDEQVDDYGIDYSKPDAEEELETRITNKGGRGANSGDRNPNDNFDE